MEDDNFNLARFVAAQEGSYRHALSEIRNGRKTSHWMWYIFPQVSGLGVSSTSRFYAISGLEEAAAYLAHPVLGKRLVEISKALLDLDGGDAAEVFGRPDDIKLKSSMTLFSLVENSSHIFGEVLHKFFNGKKDWRTLRILAKDQARR
ncbi:MAG: DUF1810 domain-containing protein [Oscillospiraceae bacterium]|jgi:uncharacterized protein (DUF1810 family)|nr:DUF1810 domain-containing protein [Oscillospiraceae bacterium]